MPSSNRKLKILLVFLFLLIGTGVFVYLQYYPRVMQAKQHTDRLVDLTSALNYMYETKDLDMQKAYQLILEADIHVKSIRVEIQPYYPFLKKVSNIPLIGDYASQAEPVLEYATHLLSAAKILIEIVYPAADVPLYANHSSRLIEQIDASQTQIQTAEDELLLAQQYYLQINSEIFPEKIKSKIDQMAGLHPRLLEAIDLLQVVPIMTGGDKPITYLIMLQNSDEIRPTGGFITAFGLLRIEKGTITALEFEDFASKNYISQIIEAPKPMKDILLAHYWLPRDANWSPSFPESAAKVQELYYLSTGIQTDGVIALHQDTLVSLLNYIGPIKVSGIDITKENIKQYMISEKMTAIEQGNSKKRKDFIVPLFNAIIDRFFQVTQKEKFFQAYDLLQKMTNKGELFVYLPEPVIEPYIQKFHLDGDLQPGNGDYLMVVESNLGINKINQEVQREVTYSVDLSNLNDPKSEIILKYINPTSGNVVCRQGGDLQADSTKVYLPPSCYWNYWRVLGNKNTSIAGFEGDSFEDSYFLDGFSWTHQPQSSTISSGINEIAGLIVVPANDTGTVTIERKLPSTVVSKADEEIVYLLNLQKQPGIYDLPFELRIKLPDGYTINQDRKTINLVNDHEEWAWKDNITQSFTYIEIHFQKSK